MKHKLPLVTLLPDEIALARQYDDELKSLGIAVDGTDPWHLRAAGDRFFYGYLGELAFGAYLTICGVIYQHRITLDGHSDAPEFKVVMDGHWRSLDVKTATNPTHQLMAQPARQALDADIYVGVRARSESQFEIWGWMPLEEWSEVPLRDLGLGVPTRACRLDELADIESLVERLDTVRRVRR